MTYMNQTPSARVAPPRAESGFTIVVFLFAAALLAAAIVVSLGAAERSRKHVNRDVEMRHLENLGDSLLTLAVDRIWEDFTTSLNGGSRSVSAVRAWLDAQGMIASASTTTSSPTLARSDYHTALMPSNSTTLTENSLLTAGFLDALGLPQAPSGQPAYGGAAVLDLTASRRDIPGGVMLTLSTRVTMSGLGDASRTALIRKSFALEPEPFRGLGFGLLANNVNCIMCHAQFDRADRYWNTDAQNYNTYEGIKVGSLEAMKIRSVSADSTIAGSFYTRGLIMDKGGSILPNLSGTSLTGFDLTAQGVLVQDATGAMTASPVQLVDERGTTDGSGALPLAFPGVIPDENNNRRVDPEEFTAVAEGATGTLSGGIQSSVPTLGQYTLAGPPVTSNIAGVTGTHTGNLILVGTESDPILITGNVAVAGDLVMAGVIKGSGTIIASGNVYVVGSLTYADGTQTDPLTGQTYRTFGVAADGAANELAIGAGGNILVGDYLSSKGGGGAVSGLDTGGFNFTLSETTLFNRAEWTRTQPTLPGPGGTIIQNPLYDANYTPRYYTYNASDPVYIYLDPADHYFDPASGTWMGSEHMGSWNPGEYMTIAPGDPAYMTAVVSSLNPAQNWMTAASLQGIMAYFETNSTAGEFKIDSMLYTNNSIMTLARSSSAYQGRMMINGGIVAADVGMLVAGNESSGDRVGLRLNYDSRLQNAFNLRGNSTTIAIRRVLRH